MMSELFGEFLGTLILILLGNGVVAGVVLPKTKSNSAGWIVITMGWGIAVAVAVFVSGKLSPAHLNPAVTVGVALKGDLPWASVLPYILAQFAGAMLGQILVWLQFKPHYEVEENAGNILATFSTGPAIKDTVSNLISEILGPRIMHSILPIPNKGDGDWSYAWIPVVGPVIGAALAVLVFSLF